MDTALVTNVVGVALAQNIVFNRQQTFRDVRIYAYEWVSIVNKVPVRKKKAEKHYINLRTILQCLLWLLPCV